MKAYCMKCRKVLTQVLSSFECLSTWDKVEEFYAPNDDCKLLKRCPDCGTLVKERQKKIQKQPIRKPEKEDTRPSHFRKRLKEPLVAL